MSLAFVVSPRASALARSTLGRLQLSWLPQGASGPAGQGSSWEQAQLNTWPNLCEVSVHV